MAHRAVGAAVAATAGAHRYCLLGVDHALATRTYAHALSVQRTEVLEWARVMAGGAHGAALEESNFLFYGMLLVPWLLGARVLMGCWGVR